MNSLISALHNAAGLATPTARRPLQRSSQLLSLEQRFMFDGAVADAAHAAQAPDASAASVVPAAVTVRAAEPAKDNGKKEVALVDTSVANYKALEAGVREGVGIVEFDGSKDGLAQIAQWAASEGGYDAIHILSHGSEGVINLGTEQLNASSLQSATVQSELAELGRALTDDGDLLLYGCDAGAGAAGSALLDGLAKATGADVAASTNATGAADKGGDWVLEAQRGKIDTDALALTQYDGVLDTLTFVDGDANSETTLTRTVGGVTITFSAWSLYSQTGYGLTGQNDDLFSTSLTISVASGYSFDLSAMSAFSGTGILHVQYTYANGASGSIDINVDSGQPQAVTSLPNLNDITSVTFSSDSDSSLQNIQISDAKAIAPTTTVDHASLSTDTGTSATDFITNTASQTIFGSLSSALGAGERVQVSFDNGSTWTDATAYTVGSTSWSTSTTLSGSNTFMARVTNSLTSSTAYSHSYTLDTTAPATTVTSASFSNDTGTYSTDFITNSASQTISGTLSANLQSGETVYVSVNNGTTWTAATTTVGQNTWSLAGVTLISGSTLRVKVTDTAGNDGTAFVQVYIYDTTAPTITFSGLGFSNDTGTSATDFITRTAGQTITATLSSSLAAGDVVWGSLDGGSTWTDVTSKVSGTALSWNGVTLGGSNTLQLKVVDSAGNQGTVKNQAYVLDTTPPAAPSTPLLSSASDTGPSNSDGITSDTTPTFSGTAESGSTVNIYDGATLLGSTVATGGVWSFTSATLSETSHTITAIATDAAGNVSAASAGLAISIDATQPSVISTAVPANSTYYSGDTLSFSVNFDEAVYVDTSGGTPRIAMVIGSTTRYASYVSGSGTTSLRFSYTVQAGDSDSNGITVGSLSANGGTLSDQAGNSATLTLNSVGSTANILVDGSQASVTGVGSSTSNGAYGPGSTLTITVDFSRAVDVDTSGGAPTLTLSSGGTATYSGGDGTSTLTFTYTVGAGENSVDLDYASIAALALNGATITDAVNGRNASVTLAAPGAAGSLGANKDLVIDTTAPGISGGSVYFSSDTGSSSTDLITKTSAQTITGTLTGNLSAGETVQVSLDNGASWTTATAATGSSNWSLAGQTLTGSDTLKVRVVDAAGNVGASASYAYVLDTSGPTTTFADVAFSNDSGASASDLVTNANAQTISATLSSALGAGDTLLGSLDNGATWTDITSKVSGTSLNWNGVILSGSNTLQLRVVDAAGNNGVATSRAYVLDTVAPTTTVASAAFSADSGSSNSDFITNVAAQTVSGSLSAALAAGESVYVSLDNGATWTAASSTVGQSTWSLAGATLTASDTLLVKVADLAGNDGAVYSQSYAYDTSAPAISLGGLALSNDSNLAGDFITSQAGQTISGTLSSTLGAGDSLYGSLDGGATWTDLGSSLSGTALSWSGVTLAGSNTLVLKVVDVAGNATVLASQAYALDTSAPTTTFGNIALSNDSGASNTDLITNAAAQTISATLSAALDAGDKVYGSLDNGASWTDITGKVSGTSLSWDGATLVSGGALQLKVVDAAGNEGAITSQAYVLDTSPSTTTVTGAAFSNDRGNDFDLNVATQTVNGTLSANLAAGESVLVSLDDGATWNAASATPGQNGWSLAGVTLSMSSNLLVKVVDVAGNDGALYSQAYTYSSQAPFIPLPPQTQLPPPVAIDLPASIPLPPPPALGGGLSASLFDAPPRPIASTGGWGDAPRPSLAALDVDSLAQQNNGSNGRGDLLGNDGVLTVNAPLADQKVQGNGERISFSLPSDAFYFAGSADDLRLNATLADGQPMPAWLKFDARLGRFEGTPPPGFHGTLRISVLARDDRGHVAVQTFTLVIGERISVSEHSQAPAGRPSLAEQLRTPRDAHAQRLAALANAVTQRR